MEVRMASLALAVTPLAAVAISSPALVQGTRVAEAEIQAPREV